MSNTDSRALSVVNIGGVESYQPLFFGQLLGLQRYDRVQYPKLVSLRKRMASYFWIPEEFDVSQDRVDYCSFDQASEHIWTSNLKFQILLDSVQGRGLSMALGPYISSPELESLVKTWEYFENIHSISYTHIIENLYPRPEVVFDDILENEAIRKRAMTVCREYNKLVKIAHPTKRDIYRLLVSINILEGIRFYVSFACSFAFAEQGQMEKSAIILVKIAQDENLHLQSSQWLLNQLPLEDDEWAQIAREESDWVVTQFEEAIREEIEWGVYLFKYGSKLGLNLSIITEWMYYLGNIRLGALGKKGVFPQVKYHPIPWINNWLNSKANVPAPQETQLSSYVNGGGIKSADFSAAGFDL